MSDTSAPPATPSASLISTTLVVYALFGVAAVVALLAHGLVLVAPLGDIIGIVAIILAHVKRADAAGTWLASHYRWLIRTFWFSVLWWVIGGIIFWILLIILIGPIIAIAIWLATTIWVLYRLIRGYVLFKDSQPVPGM
ncbi:MAG: hypothetical protein E6H55_03745 [Betaproteobacteria bacterium]|nr:MAG: hypothetical protein E6H55_03745 [Betaproteobacteria bacterium]